ncbi:hypothetical protein C2E23DRAFT_486240 [Lenzites betulinus]|nr:hypothetical protein C2E23DRAFT_486240 [Lenzites betulinus]
MPALLSLRTSSTTTAHAVRDSGGKTDVAARRPTAHLAPFRPDSYTPPRPSAMQSDVPRPALSPSALRIRACRRGPMTRTLAPAGVAFAALRPSGLRCGCENVRSLTLRCDGHAQKAPNRSADQQSRW